MEVIERRTFRSTFKLTSFFLCVGLMYPHPKTNIRRLIALAILTLTMLPNIVFVLYDVYNYIMDGNILEVTRHTTIAGPYFGGMLKALATCYTAKEAHELINEMDRDYAIYYKLPKSYQDIVEGCIAKSKSSEMNWTLIVIGAIGTYPITNAILNIKSLLYDENPRRYMIHEMNILFIDPEYKYETPFFEFFYVYCLYAVFIFMVFYIGYDSLFAILTDHACLKINIYCKRLEDALKEKNVHVRLNKITDVIDEQQRLFQFVEKFQFNYNIYLGAMLFAVLIQIGTCLYHVTESAELDIPFFAIALGSVCCIYIPCSYSTKLKHVGLESATSFYFSGWEKINCTKTKKIILFMIARAQIPLEIMGFKFILYDMSLFVSLLRSAYSIYALLTS